MPAKKQSNVPTSVDVARRAGVSQAAVSYVLNNVQNKHVSEDVRAKILLAAQELGYSVHQSARSLRSGKSQEVAIIADLPVSTYPSELFLAIQEQAFSYELTPVVYISHGLSPQKIEALLQRIFIRRPMGLIATVQSMTEEHVALARRMGIDHIVLISALPVAYAHTITLPARAAGYLATQHLLARGHHRLALVRPDDHPFTTYGFQQRLEGMQTVLAEKGEGSLQILPMHLSLTSARTLVDDLGSDAAARPTGIYAFNDEYALFLLSALADRGISVPHEMAVMGTDNITFGELMRPALTTIRFDTSSIGRRAIDILVALNKGETLSPELTQPLTPQLVLRAST